MTSRTRTALPFIAILIKGLLAQIEQPCFQTSCYPATGDLLIGREEKLSATSTCGLDRPETYCIVSHLEDQKKCFTCDSREQYVERLYPYSHRIENIVSSAYLGRKDSWWQAQNGLENVSIQLDLEAEFHFTHLIMTFKTFRPAGMLVERSYDFGKTWKVYRYFAEDCEQTFPGVRTGPIRSLDDVICESRYSQVAPSTEGEVIMRVVPPNIVVTDPYSEDVQDLLKMTNLRVNFTKLHTLGDDLLDSRPEIKEKYYYSIYEMVVRGSCSCYGHASRCLPLPGLPNRSDMVHGRCECTHNTKGLNCEQCEAFYNDLPWRPARGNQSNECKKCECNNHASRCHFDPAVYEATGRVSGGVCDDCQHNTMGRNCQECKPFYYQDPTKDIRHPEVCKPCDCDPKGSENSGECESRSDPEHNLVAGRCFCKRFVDGPRCDTCKNGYWNLREESIDGCEPCECNTYGTVGNFGCNKITGVCTCKRFVTGRNCNQCLAGYWGLGPDVDGCKACDCDFGGALNNMCEQTTGQCACRQNIIGRRCERPRPGYFITNLDYLVYEGEFARGTGNYQVVIREPVAGRPTTWTGPGFMRVSEGDSLVFTVDNLPSSMEYDIVIRYEPQMPDRWDDVRVTVERPGRVDQNSVCANSIPQDDFKATSLPAGIRYYTVSPPSCLETGVSYTIKLEFNRYKSDRATPDATALIDSIVLVPRINSIPGTPQEITTDFERYRCREDQLTAARPDLAEVCKKYLFSLGAIIHQQALDCECDPTGSVSAVCDPSGGQCQCKPNVIGRRCDKCAPGTYGFGPQGCLACNCNALGSRDNFCDVTSGQCLCIPNAYGRQCDQCQRGYYNFPNCRLCQCNGHADTCEDTTGRCIGCRDYTAGDNCELCVRGYYGDPRLGANIPCRACPCPGGQGSGFQHADTCSLTREQNVRCDCRPGYTGDRCDRCADNFYGNPVVPGGECRACFCNNNIDPDVPGSCDPVTGECLKCLYQTEGYSCERCKEGYYGDATRQTCQACVCNILGTNRSMGACDIVTGQCPCLPNVIGRACDRCAPNHWKLASGTGCEACNCDPDGSLSTQCNEFDGQCECKPGRGGLTCGECEAFYWGNPNIACYPCDCNREGSASLQCDRRTGQCECLEGVAGHKCDRCERGTTGQLPNCVPCGECFDNWDKIIQDLAGRTRLLIQEANEIKIQGVSKAYEQVFREMESKLDQVRQLIENANVSVADIEGLKLKLEQLRTQLDGQANSVQGVEDGVKEAGREILKTENSIQVLRLGINGLRQAADELKKEAEELKEQNVQGAFESLQSSQKRSEAAQKTVDDTDDTVSQSKQTRERAEQFMADNQAEFQRKTQENEDAIEDVQTDIELLENQLADVNNMVCDGRGTPCDVLCGGGGCGKCGIIGGGQSCDAGAVTKANNSLSLAKQTEDTLAERSKNLQDLLGEVEAVEADASVAKSEVQAAFDKAEQAKNMSESSRTELQKLLESIAEFLTKGGARPEDIRQVAEEVLAMSISLTPEEIENLAAEINKTVIGLTNIDEILDATRSRNETAHKLQEEAKKASADAATILDTARKVSDRLDLAEEAQDKAQKAIDQANENIKEAETHLTQVESETDAALGKANASLEAVQNLTTKLEDVKKKYVQNELSVQRAKGEADGAMKMANKAESDAADLETKYQDASAQLEAKYNMTKDAKERAVQLKKNATTLAQSTQFKLYQLRTMERDFMEREKSLTELSGEIEALLARMKLLTQEIQEKSDFYRDCQP
ncbi:laminin subunit beta-1 isoform X3 [Lingula anatina]|uniref:Laminin subunit beta-2 n=1 Tax=Lingula anatina TaxID=7574 RepID=A0A1S3IA24_LINAN|nr:laminin subunit beta-1 isoform X1 [Lingula anatina]XP_013395109.1 laminin subunit beta-1 isoform X2 [Lingula anatina]XP_023931717.1 laminin subunit beta-1 isoform X3 [Lingula anatina]|eukprot:XP_013395107.1 laminin subunit beta-1 isoform X1 [Lingula anatina]